MLSEGDCCRMVAGFYQGNARPHIEIKSCLRIPSIPLTDLPSCLRLKQSVQDGEREGDCEMLPAQS